MSNLPDAVKKAVLFRVHPTVVDWSLNSPAPQIRHPPCHLAVSQITHVGSRDTAACPGNKQQTSRNPSCVL